MRFYLGECNWQRSGRKFDTGDNWDFSNWHCHTLDFTTPTGNHKIPAGLSCDKEDRVFGGEQALSSSHPWLVYIRKSADNRWPGQHLDREPIWTILNFYRRCSAELYTVNSIIVFLFIFNLNFKSLLGRFRFSITFDSVRAAKINDNGDFKPHNEWKSGCQGVLVDSKTIITTADCASVMPRNSMF